MALKSAALAFDTAHYKGKGKSHRIPDPWKKKKESLWNGLLGGIQSGTSHGIDGTAPGCGDTWPGQDGGWARISGHWPILRELLSHAVWRRTDGVGSTYGHATGFISVKKKKRGKKNPAVMLSSSISGAAATAGPDWDDWASQGEKKGEEEGGKNPPAN